MESTTSKLYMIATPLGNAGDITLRAIELFKSLDCFFAEDTRQLKKLMGMVGVSLVGKQFYSLADHNMKRATGSAVAILESGRSVGFASDRGTPAVSDPGAFLAAEARAAGFEVLPVPGASSVASIVSVAGLEESHFIFMGFLPKQTKAKLLLLDSLSKLQLPVVIFESPSRIEKTLQFLSQTYPSGRVFLGREMTKLHESYDWLNLSDWKLGKVATQGEFTFILQFGTKAPPAMDSGISDAVELRLASDKQWAKQIAQKLECKVSDVYNALQRRKEKNA